jgi:surface protein
MQGMFDSAYDFNQPIGNWDVSSVTTMEGMFTSDATFNQDISIWDVSKVTNMSRMFNYAYSFNQPIGNWDVSSVTNMKEIFRSADAFNQPIGNWDVNNWIEKTSYHNSEKLKTESKFNLRGELHGVHKEYHENGQLKLQKYFTNGVEDDGEVITYHPDGSKARKVMFLTGAINGEFFEWWENENIKTQGYYENGLCYIEKDFDENGIKCDFTVTKFDKKSLYHAVSLWINSRTIAETRYGHISNWDVSQVTNMRDLFKTDSYGNDCTNFNEDISNWDVSKVTNMINMFYWASSFNQDLSKWDVSQVTNMNSMFCGAKSFNQPIGAWDVSKVKIMIEMFYHATGFNQPIGDWDVSSVTNMYQMFYVATKFNQPLNNWDVSQVSKMTRMLKADAFNQDLSKWPKKNKQVKFGRQMFSKEFAKNFDVNSLTRKINLKSINKDSKKAITKIKKLFKTRDYNHVDSAIELLRSLDDKNLYEYFLNNIQINSSGELITSSIFTGSRQAQPYFDYALILMINFAPKNLTIHKSIRCKNITTLSLRAMFPESVYVPSIQENVYHEDCGIYTAHQLPDLAFENLEEISIENYQNLESLKFLLNCKKLKKINISSCDNIKDANLFPEKIFK